MARLATLAEHPRVGAVWSAIAFAIAGLLLARPIASGISVSAMRQRSRRMTNRFPLEGSPVDTIGKLGHSNEMVVQAVATLTGRCGACNPRVPA